MSNIQPGAVVWVSGATGKLGTAVARMLRADGYEVLEADSRGARPVDLLDPDAVARSMAGADAIVHLAAIPSPEHVDAAELVRNNTMACFNALEQAWLAGIRTAVLASSVSINGTAFSELRYDEVPVTESTPLAYLDPYALSKDVTERIGQMYARRGMTVTALRPHWILTADEARRAAEADLDEAGVGNLWGYVDREDVARACELALHPLVEHRGYEAVLIASNETVSRTPTEELLERYLPGARRARRFAGYEGLYDTTRAEAVLGWRPSHSRH